MKPAAIRSGVSAPVFVAGIKYPSLFQAQFETGISSVSFSKALKKSGGEPCKIKRNIVVLEAWVAARLVTLKKEYAV
ncbi:hypothetical protein FACS189447_07760 [Spirochaetia bacterium]|nr:hypothetical protein FACS189447_07760 [Spirochaetia bacterium]